MSYHLMNTILPWKEASGWSYALHRRAGGRCHSQFEILTATSPLPVEVTLACISCHDTRHLEVHGIGTSGNWGHRIAFTEDPRGITGHWPKKNVMNNLLL